MKIVPLEPDALDQKDGVGVGMRIVPLSENDAPSPSGGMKIVSDRSVRDERDARKQAESERQDRVAEMVDRKPGKPGLLERTMASVGRGYTEAAKYATPTTPDKRTTEIKQMKSTTLRSTRSFVMSPKPWE
ncbi:MAG: hypothetical protein IID18_03495 [Nitrospinae bacterium]|nr:hypothetical protein [Nitrospinota bacterium]